MRLGSKTEEKGRNRRRKRLFTPIVYFFSQNILLWLVLSFIQLEFSLVKWDIWAVIVFSIGMLYSLIKMIDVYKRQKKYPSS